jgi:ethanolamine utilization protein EutA
MSDTKSMLSVGIDVGTTTTQLVFSRLELADRSRPGQVPRYGISDKSILYQSPIVFTPLLDHETIDVNRVNEWVRREYAAAGVNPHDVESGAVIITGESAKKHNADDILRVLGDMAGEFVVTVAGPHLESLIAGRGAGAAQYSQQNFCRVINIDIGGGSANSALFKAGTLVAASAMNYGGRIIEIDHNDGTIRHISAPGRLILEDLNLLLKTGDRPDLEQMRRFTDRMADLTLELIEGGNSPLAQKLYLIPPAPVSGKGAVLMLSGGIGYHYFNPAPIQELSNATQYDDLGPLLGESLRRHKGLQAYKIVQPAETLRATVLGASTQTVSLSGSTIWAEKGILPLKNVPVVRPQLPVEGTMPSPARITAALAEAVQRWDLNPASDIFAIAFSLDANKDFVFNDLMLLAEGLVSYCSQAYPSTGPLVTIIERDYAQALGQAIKSLAPDRPLIVIDQVELEEGDYIDIGSPIMDGRVVPVTVKTLVFYH